MKTNDNIKVRQTPEEYEFLIAKLGRPWDDIFLQRLKTVLKPTGKSGIMLDVGIGTGLIVREMANMPDYDGYNFIGLDYYEDMVATCRKKINEDKLQHRIQVVQGDAAKMDFPKNHFDVVMSRATLHHLADPTDALREKYRVLKPNGTCLIHDIRSDAPAEVLANFTERRAQLKMPPTLIDEKFTMAQMEDFIEKAGLKGIAQLSTEESGPGALGFELFFRK